MWYTIICEDKADSLALRLKTRPGHLQALQRLRDAGKLLTAGPFPAIDNEDPGEAGFTGTLIVAEFDSLEDAQQWVDNDPYNQQGLFTKVTIKPFKKVF